MSLTTCPHCHQNNSRWSIYLFLNKPQPRSDKQFTCPHCHHVSHLDFSKRSRGRVAGVILRSLIPLITVVSFLMNMIPRRAAIVLVIAYHFACFIGIIQYNNWRSQKPVSHHHR